jgi:hypothetical protein
MRNEGAKEARKIIKRFHECLNSPRLVPEQCYRRNHGTYSLVHYVNQITGLFLSKNYAPIPIFLNRAFSEFNRIQNDLVSEPYRRIVLSYLSHMAFFINEYCEFESDETTKSFIPKELLEHGCQDAPPIAFLPGEF